MNIIKIIFENPSISAFIGAFSAYILVTLTDWRRNRRKKKIIIKLVETNKKLIEGKREAIINTIKTLEEKKQLIGGPLQNFSVNDLQKLELEVLDYFKIDEKLSLDTIIYRMIEADKLILQSVDKVEKIRNKIETDPEKIKLIALTLINDYKDILANFDILDEMMSIFLSKKYDFIIHKKYKRKDPWVLKI